MRVRYEGGILVQDLLKEVILDPARKTPGSVVSHGHMDHLTSGGIMTPQTLDAIPVIVTGGLSVRLDQVATIVPGDGAAQLDHRLSRHDRPVGHVERLVEVDVVLVQRVPEVVVGRRDDAVEGVAATAITRHFQHCRKIVGRYRVIGLVVGDLLGHLNLPIHLK